MPEPTAWIQDTFGDQAEQNKEVVSYLTEKGYDSPSAALKAGYEAHKLNTKKTDELKTEVRSEVEKDMVPGEDWDDAKWNALGEKLRPKDIAAYKVDVPEGLEHAFKPEFIQELAQTAHEIGMPAPHFNKLAAKYMESQAAQLTALQEESTRIQAEDKKELETYVKAKGLNQATFDEISKRGQGFMAQMAGMEGDKFGEWLQVTGYDTHPVMRKIAHAIGELSNDPKFVSDNKNFKGNNAPVDKTTGQMMVEAARNTDSE